MEGGGVLVRVLGGERGEGGTVLFVGTLMGTSLGIGVWEGVGGHEVRVVDLEEGRRMEYRIEVELLREGLRGGEEEREGGMSGCGLKNDAARGSVGNEIGDWDWVR